VGGASPAARRVTPQENIPLPCEISIPSKIPLQKIKKSLLLIIID